MENITPEEAMVTPGISRNSPLERDEANRRKACRMFSSTVWKSSTFQYAKTYMLAIAVTKMI